MGIIGLYFRDTGRGFDAGQKWMAVSGQGGAWEGTETLSHWVLVVGSVL